MTSTAGRWLRVGCSAAAALSATAVIVAAGIAPRGTVLRVCADPNNLPFSNAHGDGFENELAELLGTHLHARVEYTWWAQRRGFVRRTLAAGACDVVMGWPRDGRWPTPRGRTTDPATSSSLAVTSTCTCVHSTTRGWRGCASGCR